MPSIPRRELALLEAVVRNAYALAEAGRAREGDARLDLQLAIIELLPETPWKEELVALYRLALVGYRLAAAPPGIPAADLPASEQLPRL